LTTLTASATSYHSEINVLVPLVSVAEISNTPTSKGVFVRLEPAGRQEALGDLCDRRTLR
jgi:hypothetical protein